MDSSVTLLLLAALIALVYHLLLQPLVLSPLARIPAAHWSAPLSPLWILLARKGGRENRLLLEAHKRHGSVVRVGPNAISIDGFESVKAAYQGGFEKDPWYSVFDNYGVPCMFAALNSPEHSARKRMIANVYSKSYIQSSDVARTQTLTILYDRLLPLLHESSSPNLSPAGLDVQSLFLATTMDFISAYVYGLRSSTNFIQDKGYRGHWLELYNARNNHHFWPQELPGVTRFFQKLGLWLYPCWVDDANQELANWNLELCNKAAALNIPEKSLLEDTTSDSVVFNALNFGIDKEVRVNDKSSILHSTVIEQRELSVASELFDHVLAGHETAGITLTYLAWHLSRRPDLQDRLRREMLTLQPSMKIRKDAAPQTLPAAKDLDALPFLHAVITETLRLHAPLPGPQPRRTPHPSCVIDGFHVPGGVRVAALAYTLHRDESVFPDPARWDPERWLPGSSADGQEEKEEDEQRRRRQRQFWAFGSGGRMCIGSNFAMNEMKYTVAAIYSNFWSYVVDDRGMEQTDGYASRPLSEQLFLGFEPVKPTFLVGIHKQLRIKNPTL